ECVRGTREGGEPADAGPNRCGRRPLRDRVGRRGGHPGEHAGLRRGDGTGERTAADGEAAGEEPRRRRYGRRWKERRMNGNRLAADEPGELMRKIVNRTVELAPLRTVATKAIQMAEDERSAAMDLAAVLSSDQAL